MKPEDSFRPDWVVHPGETLGELLEERVISQTELANRLGVSHKHVNQIVRGHILYSAELAVALEVALKEPTADFWMRLKVNYELGLVRQHA